MHKDIKKPVTGKLGGLYAKEIDVAKKYKISPSKIANTFNREHSDNWYKYAVYAPHDKREDGLGYVHFENSEDMLEFEKQELNHYRALCKQKPIKFGSTKFEWFLAGATFSGMLMYLAYMVWRLL